MQIFAVWYGGSSYSGGDFTDSIEMFNSVDEAISACQSRVVSGHWSPQEFDFLNRDNEKVLTPCVDETSFMHVFKSDPTGSHDPCPDFLIEMDEDDEFGVSPA